MFFKLLSSWYEPFVFLMEFNCNYSCCLSHKHKNHQQTNTHTHTNHSGTYWEKKKCPLLGVIDPSSSLMHTWEFSLGTANLLCALRKIAATSSSALFSIFSDRTSQPYCTDVVFPISHFLLRYASVAYAETKLFIQGKYRCLKMFPGFAVEKTSYESVVVMCHVYIIVLSNVILVIAQLGYER